jgi:hypothetical protein
MTIFACYRRYEPDQSSRSDDVRLSGAERKWLTHGQNDTNDPERTLGATYLVTNRRTLGSPIPSPWSFLQLNQHQIRPHQAKER